MPEDTSPAAWSAAHGDALRQRRIALGLRQQDVADLVRQPRTVVSNWENGSRAPSAVSREALTMALRISMQDIDRAHRAASDPRVAGPDRWRGMWPVVNGYLGPAGHSRVERFTRQVETFQLLATAEFAQARWQQLHAATAGLRAGVQETIRKVGSRGKGPWADSGAELASVVRGFLQLGTGPLPSLTVTAELCGIRVFLVALPDGTSGQLRGLACPVDGIGVAALLNSDLAPDVRLDTFARLLGSALLSKSASTVITAGNATAGAAKRPGARHATLTAFAEEFVLPHSALASCASTVRRMIALSPDVPGDLFEQNALADLLSTYRAGRSTTYPRYLTALGKPRSTWPTDMAAAHTAEDAGEDLNDEPPSAEHHDHNDRGGSAVRSAPTSGTSSRLLPYRPHLAEMPRGFVDLLLAEVAANRSSVAAIAELTGIDVREIEAQTAPHDADRLDDVREQEFSVA